MDFPELRAATEKLNAKRAAVKAVMDEAKNEKGEFDPGKVQGLALPDGQAFRDWLKSSNDEIDDLKKDVEEQKAVAKLVDEAYMDPESVEGMSGEIGTRARQTLGKAFVNSGIYQDGKIRKDYTATLDLDLRNTLFETGAGWAPESVRTGVVTLSPERSPSVLDYMPQIPSTQSSVKFMRETTYTATNVVEKAEGAQYGEAALALTAVTLPHEKVPAFIPVTDEQLEDVEGAEAYINARLVHMVRRRVDGQALTGTGVSPLLEGTENVTGIQTQALGVDDTTDAIYKLFVKIRDDNDNSGGDADPNVVHIRPSKWQAVALMRTTDGVYIWGSPSQAGPMTIWGVPVNLTNAVTSTKAVAGDYAMHAYASIRRGVEIKVSDSHSDYFVNGKQAIRADVRLAIVHLRPAAFGEVTGL